MYFFLIKDTCVDGKHFSNYVNSIYFALWKLSIMSSRRVRTELKIKISPVPQMSPIAKDKDSDYHLTENFCLCFLPLPRYYYQLPYFLINLIFQILVIFITHHWAWESLHFSFNIKAYRRNKSMHSAYKQNMFLFTRFLYWN